MRTFLLNLQELTDIILAEDVFKLIHKTFYFKIFQMSAEFAPNSFVFVEQFEVFSKNCFIQ